MRVTVLIIISVCKRINEIDRIKRACLRLCAHINTRSKIHALTPKNTRGECLMCCAWAMYKYNSAIAIFSTLPYILYQRLLVIVALPTDQSSSTVAKRPAHKFISFTPRRASVINWLCCATYERSRAEDRLRESVPGKSIQKINHSMIRIEYLCESLHCMYYKTSTCSWNITRRLMCILQSK